MLLRQSQLTPSTLVFPTTLSFGMRFESRQSLSKALDREAKERGIPTTLYMMRLGKGNLTLTCRVCRLKLYFTYLENGHIELREMSNRHPHTQENINKYFRYLEIDRRRKRKGGKTEVRSQCDRDCSPAGFQSK